MYTTLKSINTLSYSICVTVVLLLPGCSRSNEKKWSYNALGYWWQLLAFESDKNNYQHGNIAWVNACFKTQNDSLFYDSEHDLRDRFFVKADSLQSENSLRHLISLSGEGDSLCALVTTDAFFKQQFNKPVPFFCRNDSVVKVYFKVKKIFSPNAFEEVEKNIRRNELQEIESFFGSAQNFELSRDSMGFYWVERPEDLDGETVKAGQTIQVSYEGAFLNGRVMDHSPAGFTLVYGTPDQLIKGLNYVIGRLKTGQNSKIVLPSQLAFGVNGSSNGSIPPYTPMVYKISISSKQ